jgi:ribosomal protein S27E
MICPYCKEKIKDDAIKCKHCQSMLSGEAPHDHFEGNSNAQPTREVSEEILKELRPYSDFIDLQCLECGYTGKMGVTGKNVPWIVSWWVLIPTFFIGTAVFGLKTGFVTGFCIGFARFLVTKHRAKCPSCRQEIIER